MESLKTLKVRESKITELIMLPPNAVEVLDADETTLELEAENMPNVKELYARGCKISGNIPKHMKKLEIFSCAGGSVAKPDLRSMKGLKEVYSDTI